MTQHHIFGPSSLARRFVCPGSLHVEAALPEPPGSDISERGTRIHNYVAEMLSTPDYTMPEDVVQEEWDAALSCRDFARKHIGEHDEVKVETRLEFSLMGELLFFGTCDILILQGQDGIIIDWKTGGKAVPEADCNWQGAGYALAAMQRYNLRRVAVVFFNPGPLCRQETSCAWENQDALTASILRIHARCHEDAAPLIMSEQCQYCRGSYWGVCPLLAGKRAAAMAQDSMALSKLRDDQLVRLYRECQTLAAAADAAKAEIIERAKVNGKCDTYILTTQKAPSIIPEPILMAGDLGVPLDQLITAAKISTTQAADVIAKRLLAADESLNKTAAMRQAKEMLQPYTSAPQTRYILKEVKE